MKHPFLGKIFLFYLSAWAIIAIAHASIVYNQFDLGLNYAMIDSISFNLAFMGFGLIYWYIVQYISPESQGISEAIVSQGLAVVIGVSFLTYVCNTFLAKFSDDTNSVENFLNTAFPWRIFLGSFYLGMIVLIYYLLQYTASFKQKEKEEIELQHLLKNAELESLKFQLNPHFIFNSLNSISALTLTDADRAHEMVVKLSEFLRGSLGTEDKKTHSLKEEVEQMMLYLDIERVRFGDRLVIEENIDQACNNCEVPNLILQPLYENAIKYGIYEQLENVVITTTCTCNEENLTISISNNYDAESRPQKGKGIGLRNVRDRLELIYGQSNLMAIKKDKNIFTVELLIPQNQQI